MCRLESVEWAELRLHGHCKRVKSFSRANSLLLAWSRWCYNAGVGYLYTTFVIAASAVMLGPPASAQTVTVYGIGGDSCAQWIQYQKTEPGALTSAHWLGGFVSAFNKNAPVARGFISADLFGMQAWVTRYCNNHLTDSVATAAQAMVEYQRKRK